MTEQPHTPQPNPSPVPQQQQQQPQQQPQNAAQPQQQIQPHQQQVSQQQNPVQQQQQPHQNTTATTHQQQVQQHVQQHQQAVAQQQQNVQQVQQQHVQQQHVQQQQVQQQQVQQSVQQVQQQQLSQQQQHVTPTQHQGIQAQQQHQQQQVQHQQQVVQQQQQPVQSTTPIQQQQVAAQQQQQIQQAQQQQQQQTMMSNANLTQAMNANTMAVGATGMRNSIPQVQVIPQIQSPPYMPQFYSSQQQQFMLQNAAMQAAMQQANALNMNMNPQQINMNMNMAAMMQARSPTVSGNTGLTGGAMMSPSPTTPTQNPVLSFSSGMNTQVTVTSSNTQTQGANKTINVTKGASPHTMGQAQQAQATPMVGGKPIMPTQALTPTQSQPLVLGVLPNQIGNAQAFVNAQNKGQQLNMSMTQTGQQQHVLTNSQAQMRFTQPQIVSSNGQIFTSQPMLTNQVLQAMANLQQQGIPIAQQPLLSAPGQSPIQSVFIRPANQLQPQQGMMTTGVQAIGATMKARMDIPMNQVKATNVNVTGVTVGKAPIPALNRTAKINPTPQSTVGRPKLAVPNIRNPTRGRPRTINKVTSVTPPTVAVTSTVASTVTTVTTETKPVNQAKHTPPVSMAVTPTPQVKVVTNGVTDAATKSTNAEPVLSMNNITQNGDATHVEKMETDISPDKPLVEEKLDVKEPAPVLAPIPTVERQKAIVKPHILTHVIEGFVIQEGHEPFPVDRCSLLTEFIPPKPNQEVKSPMTPSLPASSDGGATGDEMSASEQKQEPVAEVQRQFDKCEFCGKEEQSAKFKRSKRFCSMACAKRFNVACSKRVSGLYNSASNNSVAGKVMKKKKVFSRKGWRHSDSSNRLSFNASNKMTEDDADDDDGDHGERSTSPSSGNESSTTTPDSPTTVQDSADVEMDSLPSNPAHWNVTDVYEFIKSMPGCTPYADEFKSQEIDGQALMLLKEDHLMTAMNMKLGPALKICARINSMKEESG